MLQYIPSVYLHNGSMLLFQQWILQLTYIASCTRILHVHNLNHLMWWLKIQLNLIYNWILTHGLTFSEGFTYYVYSASTKERNNENKVKGIWTLPHSSQLWRIEDREKIWLHNGWLHFL